MVCSGAKLFRTKTLLNFASKALSNSFFQKTRFRFEFLYKIAPHLISFPNGLDGTIGGKSVPEWSFVHPKKPVFGWNFFMKPAPYLFSGPNSLYGSFGGKIDPDENFGQLCLISPLEFVFPKNTFSVWIFVLNRTSPIFLDNGLDGTIGGKSIPEWSFVHPKKHVFGWNFLMKPAPSSFLGLIGYMVHSGAKLFRMKTFLNFASKALSNTFFQKTRFRFEFLY